LQKDEIIKQLHAAGKEFYEYCLSIDSNKFFHQPAEKWSIAQNVKHLIISANTTRLAYSLPKFIIKLYVGKPNRSSRSYDELVSKYKMKLQQGGKASGRFIPQKLSNNINTDQLLDSFNQSMAKLRNAIETKWTEQQLDQYIAPHPLLGKITLRELGYFTIHHTYHHLNIIKERLNESVKN
jgi:hypothetical protein